VPGSEKKIRGIPAAIEGHRIALDVLRERGAV